MHRQNRDAQALAEDQWSIQLTHAVLVILSADCRHRYRERQDKISGAFQNSEFIEGPTQSIQEPAQADEEGIRRELKAGRRPKMQLPAIGARPFLILHKMTETDATILQ